MTFFKFSIKLVSIFILEKNGDRSPFYQVAIAMTLLFFTRLSNSPGGSRGGRGSSVLVHTNSSIVKEKC
ncbi:MAG: hypothetical protein ACRC2M_22990 [Planktothrix sp.]